MTCCCRHRVSAVLVSRRRPSTLQPCHLSADACRTEGVLDGHEDAWAAETGAEHPEDAQQRLSLQGKAASASPDNLFWNP